MNENENSRKTIKDLKYNNKIGNGSTFHPISNTIYEGDLDLLFYSKNEEMNNLFKYLFKLLINVEIMEYSLLVKTIKSYAKSAKLKITEEDIENFLFLDYSSLLNYKYINIYNEGNKYYVFLENGSMRLIESFGLNYGYLSLDMITILTEMDKFLLYQNFYIVLTNLGVDKSKYLHKYKNITLKGYLLTVKKDSEFASKINFMEDKNIFMTAVDLTQVEKFSRIKQILEFDKVTKLNLINNYILVVKDKNDAMILEEQLKSQFKDMILEKNIYIGYYDKNIVLKTIIVSVSK